MPAIATLPGHLKATWSLGLPLVGSQIGHFVIQLTDTVMMGWYGVAELAALSVASGVIMLLLIVGAGFAWGMMPMAAAAAEAGDDTAVRRVTRMGLWASMGFCVAVVLPLWLVPDLYGALGQTAEVARLANAYFAIAAWNLVPALLMMLLRSYLAALEHPRAVFNAMLAAAIANAGLNWILIFGNLGAPEMGVRGAALASILTNSVAAGLLVAYARRLAPQHALFARLWRPDWAALARVVRVGLPIGLTNLAEVGLFAASSIIMGWVGTLALAAHGIALQLATLVFMVHLGVSQAVTVRAGQAAGRGDRGDLRLVALAGITLSGVVALVTILLFLAVPGPLIRLFLDPGAPQAGAIVALGVSLLAAAALFQMVDAAQVMALGLLRGVQDTRVPMIYAVVSYWGLGAPVAYGLALHTPVGAVGVWLGLAVGLATAAGLMMFRFWCRALPGLRPAAPGRALAHDEIGAA